MSVATALEPRVGFPIVRAEVVYAVWVVTRVSRGRGTCFWNGDALSAAEPFKSPQLLGAVRNIVDCGRDLFFHTSCPQLLDQQTGTVDLVGESAGVAMALAKRFELTESAPTLRVLVTGGIRQDGGPKPLGDPGLVTAKVRFAANQGLPLLVLEADYQLLLDPTVRFDQPEARLPESLEDLARAIADNRQRGRAFVLPLGITGSWYDGNDWVAGLGSFLGLSRSAAPPVRAEVSHQPKLLGAEDAVPANSIASLFRSALPTQHEYFSEVLARNRELWSRPLFAGGPGALAVDQSSKVFGTQSEANIAENVLIVGPTACGKTFLAEALMLNSAVELGRPALYISPTRALAQERHRTLLERFGTEEVGALPKERVILATGEISRDDWRLRRAEFQLAILVNEKANVFLRPDSRLLRELGMVVLDEVHMLADVNRGGVLDMLIAKLKAESDERIRHRRPPLRLVVLTTEAASSGAAVRGALEIRTGVRTAAPIVLASRTRPVAVEHVARTYGPAGVGVESEVIRFSTEGDRQLTPDRLRTIGSRIFGSFPRSASRLGPLRNEGSETTSNLLAIIQGYAAQYRTLLVIHPSIRELRALAQRLKNERRAKYYMASAAVAEHLKKRLSRGSVARSVAEELVEMSRYEVFLHHAELPLDVRDWVEKQFSVEDGVTDPDHTPRHAVLFATDTLCYGVNLTADCVLLTNPVWTREDPVERTHESEELTATEFHNILGRAGRAAPKVGEPAPKAVFCLPATVFAQSSGKITDLLRKYYATEAAHPLGRDAISGLLEESNLRRLPSKLDNVAFPTFRSVMDGLRHVGGDTQEKRAATASDVGALMEGTVFFEEHSGERDGAEAMTLVRQVLRLSAEAGLATGNEALGYRITAQAAALIDTGTHWQSVKPMERWLCILREIKASEGTGLDLPAELLLPAFLASAELWNPARMFCWEASERLSPGAQHVESENAALLALKGELGELVSHAGLQDVICVRLREFVEASGLEVNGSPVAATAVCMRLFAAFLRWLRGADRDFISELSLRSIPEGSRRIGLLRSEGKTFRDRYAERAAWLATACARYFGQGPEIHLLPEHVRELPRFSQRLRLGVRTAGLPLVSQAKAGLTREEVAALGDAGITGWRVVTEAAPSHLIGGLAGDGLLTVRQRAPEIVDDVFRFYYAEWSNLAGALQEPDTEGPWLAFEETMRRVVNRRSSGEGLQVGEDDARSYCGALAAMLAAASPGALRVVPQDDGVSVRLISGHDEFLIAIRRPNEAVLPPAPQLEIVMPWAARRSAAGVTTLTACGGIVLAYLIGREFLASPIPKLKAWVTSSGACLKSSADLLEDFEMPTLIPEIVEAIRGFNEPGVPPAGY